jgi:plasmid replication initiation protein
MDKTVAMNDWMATLYRLDAAFMVADKARRVAEAAYDAAIAANVGKYIRKAGQDAEAALTVAEQVANDARAAVTAHEATNPMTNPMTDAEELAYWMAREARDDAADANLVALVRRYVESMTDTQRAELLESVQV